MAEKSDSQRGDEVVSNAADTSDRAVDMALITAIAETCRQQDGKQQEVRTAMAQLLASFHADIERRRPREVLTAVDLAEADASDAGMSMVRKPETSSSETPDGMADTPPAEGDV
jgi:hypothetical protein